MILHIAEKPDWEQAQSSGIYQAPSLEEEGFIHCSTVEQVLGPANTMFHGRQGLLLLVIDPERVKEEIVFEDCYESGEAFPHIYGALNLEAVVQAIPFPPQADGSFILPPL